jgi:hypothetical protein
MNPKVPKTYRGIHMRVRLRRHERVERKLREGKGYRGSFKGEKLSYRSAHRQALKAEHEGLTPHERQVYEGKLGSIARNS